MKAILLLLLLGGFLIMPTSQKITTTSTNLDTIEFVEIADSFSKSHQISLIKNNKRQDFSFDTDQYKQILDEFYIMLENSHQTPAFGVSIDDLTRQELKKGVWLEFSFSQTCYNSDMPFEKLLINVQPEFCGFNVIRNHQNQYEGRCFYINLSKDMTSLYNLLLAIN